ncbi:Fe3+-hydroxamate ABC transporter permease FhuB [Methylopila jiangsuensis]|uniref:Fe3+-hydroxamate ABC transporter permease FhuB n=1 Tax=Methylopila jiangsuensis TaxID=586230 RepID=A0A9W6JGS2_9HYPH|nr:iron ABC transporter permease [Methylopila jiangsuensis]MDR6285976.1 iron complex transport system permease protein [Methylopila jiangsuensis]GLK75734.1 Fe3+-hydroxamate ABC transporter permease FhuB [Methylopila jiangsuensis]
MTPRSLFAAALFAAAAALFAVSATRLLPPAEWLSALLAPPPSDVSAMIAHYTLFPRVAVALAAGAALALSGLILQIALDNPLAEPSTTGVSAGAVLALALFGPAGLGGASQSLVALAGGLTAVGFTLALASRGGMKPATIVIAGLVLSFAASAATTLIALFNHEWMRSLFLWSSGSLRQNDWSATSNLVALLAVSWLAAAGLVRAFTLAALRDAGAAALGGDPKTIRLTGLALAAGLAALTTAEVGAIAFVGLAAPHLARAVGARTVGARLLWTPIYGAGLLWLTDEMVKLIPLDLPTGAATGLLGAPLLMALAARMRRPSLTLAPLSAPPRRRRPQWGALLVAALAALAVALVVERTADGWTLATLDQAFDYRVPRSLAAFGAGMAVAVAGALLQRMTGNAMASPDMIGVSAGAALGFLALLYVAPMAGAGAQLVAGGLGAGVAAVWALKGVGRGAPPEQPLLLGVGVASAFTGVVSFLLASGDPRMALAVTWLSGSTYQADASRALVIIVVAAGGLAAALALARPLQLLPLGSVARSSGLRVGQAQALTLALSSVLTAAATLVIGPLSFVGLIAPHAARSAGCRSPASLLAGSALIGGALLAAADWIGRVALFPYEVPAGVIAMLLGGAAALVALSR